VETEKNTTKNENKTTLRVTNRPPYRMVRVRSLLISTVVPIYFQTVQLHKLPSLPKTRPQLNHQKNGRHHTGIVRIDVPFGVDQGYFVAGATWRTRLSVNIYWNVWCRTVDSFYLTVMNYARYNSKL